MLLLLAIPLAYLLVVLFESYGPLTEMLPQIDEVLNGTSRLTGAYIVSLAGLYFTRMTIGAIKKLTEKKIIRIMIDKSLTFITKLLNRQMKLTYGFDDDRVVPSSLINPDGSVTSNIENKVIVSVINLEHETAMEPDCGTTQLMIREPMVKLRRQYISICICWFQQNYNSGNYLEAHKMLSTVISVLQGKSIFHKARLSRNGPFPGKTALRKCFNLPINELSHIWSAIGAKYVPSIIYKVRMMAIQDQII